MAFAVKIAEGEKEPDDCPALPEEKREQLKAFLSWVRGERSRLLHPPD